MLEYHKYIGVKGSYFTRLHEKKKKHADKLRYIREETVLKQFLSGDATVCVHIEGKEDFVLDSYSESSLIASYLGHKFLG